MKTLLGERKQYFTNTRLEAEELVSEAKQTHGTYLKDYTIAKKTKKDVEYFIVTIVVEYYKAKELVVTD